MPANKDIRVTDDVTTPKHGETETRLPSPSTKHGHTDKELPSPDTKHGHTDTQVPSPLDTKHGHTDKELPSPDSQPLLTLPSAQLPSPTTESQVRPETQDSALARNTSSVCDSTQQSERGNDVETKEQNAELANLVSGDTTLEIVDETGGPDKLYLSHNQTEQTLNRDTQQQQETNDRPRSPQSANLQSSDQPQQPQEEALSQPEGQQSTPNSTNEGQTSDNTHSDNASSSRRKGNTDRTPEAPKGKWQELSKALLNRRLAKSQSKTKVATSGSVKKSTSGGENKSGGDKSQNQGPSDASVEKSSDVQTTDVCTVQSEGLKNDAGANNDSDLVVDLSGVDGDNSRRSGNVLQVETAVDAVRNEPNDGPSASSLTPKANTNKTKNGKLETPRESSSKKTASAAPRSPKMDRSPRRVKKDVNKADTKTENDKSQKPDSRQSARSGPTKPTDKKDPKSTDGKLDTSEKTPTDAGRGDSKDKPGSAQHGSRPTQDGKHKAQPNGQVQTGRGVGRGGEHDTNTKTPLSQEEEELQLKAHALLSKAVMRKMANMQGTDPHKGRIPGADPADPLNSSAGANSLSSSGGARSLAESQSRPAHKTTSMQSLTVPMSGLGATPTVPEDPLGESVAAGGGDFNRRDSVRHSADSMSRKSVDVRMQQTTQAVPAGGGDDKPKPMMHDDSMIRAAIPFLPVPLAVLFLILNILVPGSGTVLSGLSTLCCGKSRVNSKGDTMVTTVCVNAVVGAAQLSTVTFLLVGWFWSLAWGIKMVILAVEYRAEGKQAREKELQALALRAFGSNSPNNPLRRNFMPNV